jgi:hypothetical protein
VLRADTNIQLFVCNNLRTKTGGNEGVVCFEYPDFRFDSFSHAPRNETPRARKP